MNTRSTSGPRPFQLKLLPYANCYYIERIARLETALSRRPRRLQIDLIGIGEIPADSALLIRSVLMGRSPCTEIVTRARSSLQGGAVLVWLMGDRRLIRDDARLFFRRANLPDDDAAKSDDAWKAEEPNPWESSSDIDPEEGDYARVLQVINEFLPIQELAGRFIEVPVLRQFGLVDHEQADHYLATVFGKALEPAAGQMHGPEQKGVQGDPKMPKPRPMKK